MPKQLLAKYTCSRCERDWFVDYVDGKSLKDPPSFEAVLLKDGELKPVKYEELCTTCSSSIENYLKSITLEREPGAKKKQEASSEGTDV